MMTDDLGARWRHEMNASLGNRYLARAPWGASAVRAWRTLLLGLALGIGLGAALPPAWGGLSGAARTALAAASGSAAAQREWEPRPLPREWRWSPPGVDVSGMFRRSRAGR
jgi:hypothetical protein